MRPVRSYFSSIIFALVLAVICVAATIAGCGSHHLGALPDVASEAQIQPDACLIGTTPPPTGNFIVEFLVPTASAGLRDITHGPCWEFFTEFNGSKIGRISMTGQIVEYKTLTHGAGPWGVGVGFDQNLWFTENLANKIGRMSYSGTSQVEFKIPTSSAGPRGLWSGPNASMWFVETAANKIGEIKESTGVVTEFPIPTASSGANSIAQGADKNMWFTENAANKIGRITAAGVFTEWNLPTVNAHPTSIVPVEDENMYFLELGANKIGKITVNGKITEFPVPFSGAVLSGLGPGDKFNHGSDSSDSPGITFDDQMWFTDKGNDKVSGFNPYSLDFNTPLAIPHTSSGAGAITYGADNNEWFIETTANEIGRYNLPTPPPSPSPSPSA
jgi:virginiamycin B lyase